MDRKPDIDQQLSHYLTVISHLAQLLENALLKPFVLIYSLNNKIRRFQSLQKDKTVSKQQVPSKLLRLQVRTSIDATVFTRCTVWSASCWVVWPFCTCLASDLRMFAMP